MLDTTYIKNLETQNQELMDVIEELNKALDRERNKPLSLYQVMYKDEKYGKFICPNEAIDHIFSFLTSNQYSIDKFSVSKFCFRSRTLSYFYFLEDHTRKDKESIVNEFLKWTLIQPVFVASS